MSRQLAIILILLCMCVSSAAQAALPILKPGDVIAIAVDGEKDISRNYQIDPTGNIEIPLMGKVMVSGKTVDQAQQAVTEQLKQYIKEPSVQIQLIRQMGIKFSISGDVKSPGDYIAVQDVYLRDSLAFAGGALPTADLSDITIARGGRIIKADLNVIMASTDPSKDIKLEDGDRITVASRILGSFTILGAVKAAGTYPVVKGMRVLDALKAAGDVADGSRVEKIRIIHADKTEEVVDLYKLRYGGDVTQNKLILPDDTVVVVGEQTGPAVYSVMGAVLKPGRFDLGERLTVTDALASAGGFTSTAKQDQCVLARRQPDGKYKMMPLNFKEIFAGREAANMQLQDGDIINVPDRGVKGPSFLDRLGALSPLIWAIKLL